MTPEPPAAAPRALAPVVPMSRFRADVARAAARRGQALLEAPDLAAQVQAMPPLEAYFIVKELGLDDALPLLAHATDAQMQLFIDLDCWDDGSLEVAELDVWLAAFQSRDSGTLTAAFSRVDAEAQILFMARTLVIYDAREEADAAAPDLPTMTTPDGTFVLQLRDQDEREVPPFELVTALYRADGIEAARLLTNARWELPSSLEEEALRFRDGRLADYGVPDAATAAALFARPPRDPGPLVAPMGPGLPGLYASAMQPGALFTEAMALLFAHAHLARLEAELVLLVNTAVVAYGGAPRSLQHVSAVAERVRDTLSLGLEALCTADGGAVSAAAAAACLQQWPLRQVFQWGHAQVVPLQAAAQATCRLPHIAAWLAAGNVDDDDARAADRAFLTALAQRRPLWGGHAPLRPDAVRAFASRAELEAAGTRLQQLARAG